MAKDPFESLVDILSEDEDFFIGKVKQGLANSGQTLAPEDEALLRQPVTEVMGTTGLTPERGKALEARCAAGLSAAYLQDTAGRDRTAVQDWRLKIDAIHVRSAALIAAIVQNWYLSAGRVHEKKAAGCLAVLAVTGLGASLWWLLLAS